MQKFYYLFLFALLCSQQGRGQNSLPIDTASIAQRTYTAKRISQSPKIDGILNDTAYKEAIPWEGIFYQISPNNGAPASYKTKLYLVYNDYGLYIAAYLYDPDPASIPQELSKRDDTDGKNVDMFGVTFDPVNKGQNGFFYGVSASGVQADAVISSNNFDDNWDAVWNSDVKITQEGWVVEMEIPYSAIRFPKQVAGNWGINFFRASKRLNEETTWNFINQEVSGFLNQSGVLQGLSDIEPPLRLSFSPYISGAVSHDAASNSVSSTYAGGMDLKWGLSESFTLDMSLIPDFSQVQSDDQVLNLTPFEVRFDENRPFFTEGVELFSKGNIFYSRRVGQSRGQVDYNQLDSTEEVVSLPSTAPLLNATKVSGRTSKGTGIGVFNAISRETFAVIKNTETGATRDYLIDPLTNYNVLVLDQNLKNNSNFGIINTSTWRSGSARDANVTVGQIRLRDKTNTWSVFADGGYSYVVKQGDTGRETTTGFRNTFAFSKVSGKFNFRTGVNQVSDTWDINDLGFLRAPNEFSVFFRGNYNIYKPFSVFNAMNTWFGVSHQQLYSPRTYTEFRFNAGSWFQFKNFYTAGGGVTIKPVESYDYFEPREPGRYFRTESSVNVFLFAGSDSRKPFSLDLDAGFWYRKFDNALYLFTGISPRYRVNNKLNISLDIQLNSGENGKGFVTKVYDDNDNLDKIIFGNRTQQTISQVIGVNYTFNEKMALTFRLRHYWSWAKYNQFYKLEEDGTLGKTNFDGFNPDGSSDYNSNFNAFNIDMVYSWQVAPGSFVNINWKDAIFNFTNKVGDSYGENIIATMQDDHLNTLSVKFIYFIDISYFKKFERHSSNPNK